MYLRKDFSEKSHHIQRISISFHSFHNGRGNHKHRIRSSQPAAQFITHSTTTLSIKLTCHNSHCIPAPQPRQPPQTPASPACKTEAATTDKGATVAHVEGRPTKHSNLCRPRDDQFQHRDVSHSARKRDHAEPSSCACPSNIEGARTRKKNLCSWPICRATSCHRALS